MSCALGRFHFIWAGMDVEINPVGKLRKNTAVSEFISSKGVGFVDKDMLWPDAWKVTIDIKDFTPNNFNAYADFYMNGWNQDEILQAEGTGDEGFFSAIADEFTYYFDKLKSFGDTDAEQNAQFDKLSDMANKTLDKKEEKPAE